MILLLLFFIATNAFTAELSQIAFGSCNKPEYKNRQKIWNTIGENNPQLWIWMGDNVYADTTDFKVMQSIYNKQKNIPYYQDFIKSLDYPVIGTWDDHDYGANDAGKHYVMKQESQQLFLDFFDIPKEHPLRSQQGVYQSYTYGEKGQQVKVILLDTRYHRDDPSEEGDVLGEAQWQWLEQELYNSQAQIHLIVSSIQVLPLFHPFEKWNNFPKARQRFLETINNTAGVILLSGDRHIAELLYLERENYRLYELTTSGLTHSWKKFKEKMPQLLLMNNRIDDVYTDRNFGLMHIDWQEKNVTLQVKGADNHIHIEHSISFSDLGL